MVAGGSQAGSAARSEQARRTLCRWSKCVGKLCRCLCLVPARDNKRPRHTSPLRSIGIRADRHPADASAAHQGKRASAVLAGADRAYSLAKGKCHERLVCSTPRRSDFCRPDGRRIFGLSSPLSSKFWKGTWSWAISMNPKLSGFTNWVEIHEPTKIDEARIGAKEDDVVAATDVGQEKKPLGPQPHRPWRVPGASKLQPVFANKAAPAERLDIWRRDVTLTTLPFGSVSR